MKKLLTFLTLILATLLISTGCTKEKPYSIYNIGADADNWQGGTTEMQNKIAGFLLSNDFVRFGIVVEGDDVHNNDQEAIKLFKAEVDRLNPRIGEIEAQVKGMEGAPCTVAFRYLLVRGSNGAFQITDHVFKINVVK